MNALALTDGIGYGKITGTEAESVWRVFTDGEVARPGCQATVVHLWA